MGFYDATGRQNIVPDPVLTNISVEFANVTDYIAGRLFPTVRVSQQSSRYLVFGRKSFRVNYGGDVRAPGSRANELEGTAAWSEDTYFATEHALENLIPDEEGENTEARFNSERDATEDLVHKLMLGRELAARDLVHDDTQYHASHVVTLSGTSQWNDYSGTSDPISVFRTAFRQFHSTMGTVPNIAVIPWRVMSYLEDHPKIIERYSAQGGVMTPEMIASILGVSRILVPGGSYNQNSNPAVAASLSYIWGNHVVLGFVPNRPALRTPALGYEFLWPIRGGRNQADAVSVDRRRDNDRIGNIIRARRRYDLKLVGKDPDLAGTPLVAGYLIKNAIA